MSTTNPNSKQASESRRQTRLNQMELMEAAARGTAPSMQLDTSHVQPSSVSGLRSRNTSSASMEARRFLVDEEDVPGSSHNVHVGPNGGRTGTTAGTASLFNQHDLYGVDQSVNLMDPATESYTSVPSTKRTNFVDIFIGGSGSTSGTGSSRGRGSVRTTWQQSLGGRLLVLCVFVGFGVFLAMSVSFVLQGDDGSGRGGMGNFVKTGNRYEDIKTVLLLNSASHTEYLTDKTTSAYHALRWLTETDPRQLEADDPELLSRFALASFYYETHPNAAEKHSSGETTQIDSGWKKDSNWMSEKSVCQWFGVDCQSILGNMDVVHLNLTSNDVRGNIPLELRSLTNMILLDLSNNELEGHIPQQVFRMFQITYLMLQNNQLSGSLPSQINMMEGLIELHLTKNSFHGSIPSAIASLSNLKTLDLGQNAFQGTIPDLSKLKGLAHLNLQENSFTGALPYSIALLTNLHDLRLNKNKLTGTVLPELGSNKNLKLLYLGHNELDGALPDFFDDLRTLTDLELHNNKFTGTLPKSMQYLTNLRRLTIDYNKFEGSIPPEFGKMTNLEALGMHHCDLKGSIPTTFGSLTKLVHVYLNHNFFQFDLPSQLSQLTNLKDLFLEHNAFRGSVPTEFAKMTSLQNFRIFETIMTGTMPDAICDMKDKYDLTGLEADCGKVSCECCTTCH